MSTLLYNRSCYSLLSSCLTIRQMVDFAVDNGYEAVGLIDKNVMFGVMDFYQYTTAKKIKPIYGLEVSVNLMDNNYPFVLLAKNLDGFRELISISTYLNTESSSYSREQLDAISDNIYIIDVCYGGYIEKNINNARDVIRWYKEKNIFIGLKPSKGIYDCQLNSQIDHFAFENGLTTIAMPLSLYEKAEDYDAYNVMASLNNTQTISESNSKYGYNLLSLKEYYSYYNEMNRVNTETLVSRCNVDLSMMEKASLPAYSTGKTNDRKLFLTEYAKLGLRKRFEGSIVPVEYVDRLKYELDVITSMGFENYFLIVWDIIRYARNRKINIGIGRGSVAGSLVAYCLGITHIDPIKYGLLFERFLNPERISLPDIDIDIPDNKRGDVIAYVRDSYGKDNISNIVSFSTFAPKQVLKDVGNVMNVSAQTMGIITGCIPNNYRGTLTDMYSSNDRFKQAINSSESTQKMFQIALKLEGLPKQVTTHAAGIVIASKPLINYVPLIKYGEGFSCQYEMKYLEDLGLIKIDFLGLRNLRLINDILNEIPDPVNIFKIDLNDQETYSLICRADTTGIFQLESEGMRNLIRNLQPDQFNEIVDIVALYRPGPMKFIPDYIEAKKTGKINYIHPDLKDILGPTYGVMIYQEQVMQIVQRTAGFTYGKADILRKAISKKNEEELLSLKNDYIAGAIRKGYSSIVANEIFDQIDRFAAYGFNKSHSVAYASIAYQQAYLKAHYPLVFYKTLLNDFTGNAAKSNEILAECRRNGINFIAPDVNISEDSYTVIDDKISAPLSIIKSLDRNTVKNILEERKNNGPFRNYTDFICRCFLLKVKDDQIKTLIISGSCDCFKESRATMLSNISIITTYAETCYNAAENALDYSLAPEPAITRYTEIKDKLKLQQHVLDIYINGHPTETYKRKYPNVISSLTAMKIRGKVALVLKANTVKEHYIQNSASTMCFVDGEDETGTISLAIMPELYAQIRDKIKKNSIYYVEGDIGNRDSVRVRKLLLLD